MAPHWPRDGLRNDAKRRRVMRIEIAGQRPCRPQTSRLVTCPDQTHDPSAGGSSPPRPTSRTPGQGPLFRTALVIWYPPGGTEGAYRGHEETERLFAYWRGHGGGLQECAILASAPASDIGAQTSRMSGGSGRESCRCLLVHSCLFVDVRPSLGGHGGNRGSASYRPATLCPAADQTAQCESRGGSS
jgi:hypothetical protein